MASHHAGSVDKISRYPSSARVLLKDGKPPVDGGVFVQADLGRTLQAIVRDGYERPHDRDGTQSRHSALHEPGAGDGGEGHLRAFGCVLARQRAGCELRFCDAHHIVHWADGGGTRLDNVVLLCRRHHRAVHEGGFRIGVTAAGELQFYRPDGRLLPAVSATPVLPSDAVTLLAAKHHALDIDAATTTPRWHGKRLDLDFAVRTLHPGRWRDNAGDRRGAS